MYSVAGGKGTENDGEKKAARCCRRRGLAAYSSGETVPQTEGWLRRAAYNAGTAQQYLGFKGDCLCG